MGRGSPARRQRRLYTRDPLNLSSAAVGRSWLTGNHSPLPCKYLQHVIKVECFWPFFRTTEFCAVGVLRLGQGCQWCRGKLVPVSYEFGPTASAFFRLRPNGMLDQRGPAAGYLVQRRLNFRSIRCKDDSITLNLTQLTDGFADLVNICKRCVHSVFFRSVKKQ